MKTAASKAMLILQLGRTTQELERLRSVLLPQYAGKIAEPDIIIINQARRTLAACGVKS